MKKHTEAHFELISNSATGPLRRSYAIIQLWLLKAIEYRTELLVWSSVAVFNTVIYLCIWISLFRGQPLLLGYSLNQIIHYYVLATIINGITASHFESWRCQEIREGKIDHFLTKPIPYPMHVLLADIGNRIVYIAIILPLTLAVYLGYLFAFQLEPLAMTPGILLQCVGLLIFGYLVEFSFAMISVMLTFWFESGEGLEHFKWIIMSLFTGYMVPIEFMPEWLRSTVNVLPLKYVYSVPIQVAQGRTSLELFDVMYILSFLVFLYLIQRFLWKKAVKTYTSAGG